MPERRKLTKEAIQRLRMPEGQSEHTVWDTELKGFGVRLRDGGSRNFIVKFRVGGRSRQVTLGPASSEGLASARSAAAKALQDAKAGDDPQAAKSQRHDDARENIGSLIEAYLAQAEKRLRPATAREVRRHLLVHCKPLHGRSARSITRADIARRLDELTETSGPVSANRARAALSALFTWALTRGRVPANPVIGIEPNTEVARDRVLAPGELLAIWQASADEGEFGRIVRLLILTACRRQEIGDMRWSELSADGTTWTIPGQRTKNKTPHLVTLAPLAQAILAEQPKRQVGEGTARHVRDLVFGKGRGESGYQGWTRAKWRLDARIAAAAAHADGRDKPTAKDHLKPWTLHDFRRTFATVCAEQLEILPHVVEACLNHQERRNTGVASVYNRATYAEPMARAWKAYAGWIDRLLTGQAAATNVVALRR